MNIYQDGNPASPDCQLSWYAFVYCRGLERQSRLFLWTSGRQREGVQIARKRRQKEGGREEEEGSFLQPERLAEGWRLRAAVRREDLSWSRERERERGRGITRLERNRGDGRKKEKAKSRERRGVTRARRSDTD